MEGRIIKAAFNESALHMHTSMIACTCSCNVSDLEIQLVTRLDRAGLRIMAENNIKLFWRQYKTQREKIFVFLMLDYTKHFPV